MLDYDSDASDGPPELPVDGMERWTFQMHLWNNQRHLKDDSDINSPYFNPLNHISLWWGESPYDPSYNINDDDMSWDNDNDDIDSTEDIFVEDDVREERRPAAIGQARILKDSSDCDDWDPPEEPIIPRMPFFVPDGE